MKKYFVKNKIFITFIISVITVAASIVLALFVSTGLPQAETLNNDNTKEVSQNMQSVYEIYPTPHSITYGSGVVTVTDDVKVEFGSKIDEVTKAHLFDALSKLDVVAASSAAETATKVLIGVYGSGDAADAFISAKTSLDASLFERIDAHAIYIGDNAIAVVGKDTDAAFYGISTLDLIFGQVKNKAVRELAVTDYSDSIYRGFIEGYYGVPWTTDERIELMRFGSRVKSNIYIYAPKDDPYHSSNWRGLYKSGDLAALKEQIKAGAETKTLFTWAIHPFMENSNPFRRATFDADLSDLLAKLQQVYDAGVRQFMVSADDIMEENRDAECQRDLLNAVQAWLEEKGDCGNLIFVGSAYSGIPDQTRESYYAGLMNGLDERIVIMWTGAKISSRLSNCAYDMFDELTGGRQPFIWMNWPVSDYCTSNVLLGAGEVFDVKTTDGDLPFSGVVVNPMQHAELSKISIFATADYCWNVNGFDVSKNYEDCFKYIDAAEPQALKNIAVHLTNPNGEFDGGYFAESEELKRYINRYKTAYASGDYAEAAENLINQLEIIVSASEIYEAGAANIALRDSIRPWSEGLKRMAVAAQQYLELAVAIKDGAKEEHEKQYNAANATLDSVKECLCPVLGPAWQGSIVYNPVVVGPRVLTPFVKELAEEMTERVALSLGLNTGLTVKGFPEVWRGTKVEAITDGDPNTCVHFAGAPTDGAFIRVDLGETTQITKLRLLNGTSAADGFAEGDDAISGYIDYSVDGINYTKLCDINGPDTLVSLAESKKITARYIRIVSDGTRHYAALRELYVNSLGGHTGAIVTSKNFGVPSIAYGDPTSNMLKNAYDGNIDTVVAFNKDGREDGGYVDIDLMEEVDVSYVRVLTGNNSGDDAFNGHVEYSLDGDGYIAVGEFNGTDSVIVLRAPVKARHIRVVVDKLPIGWMALREVILNDLGGRTAVIGTHNFGSCQMGSGLYDMLDGDPDTFAWFDYPTKDGDDYPYVEIDYLEVKSISALSILVGMPTGGDGFDGWVEYSADGETWTEVEQKIQSNALSCEFDAPVSARYVRIYSNAPNTWQAIREVTIG